MMKRSGLIGLAAVIAAAAGTSQASVTITYTNSAPTYANTLTFDEVGGPTGLVAQNAFAGLGISSMYDGTLGNPFIGPGSGVGPWLGTGNLWGGSFGNPFGAFMEFSQPITAFSCQYWDDSGPGSPIGGGAIAVAVLNGVEQGSFFINNPTFGPTGPTWVNMVADPGMSFDEVRLVGFGFTSLNAYVDNISWTVPAPSSIAMLGLGGLVATRRRRVR
jgi:hypothetical protein